MLIEIKRYDTSAIIISGEYESIADCLQKNPKGSFYRADLSGAYLRGAYLRGADLSGAYLRGADLKKLPHLNTPPLSEYIAAHKLECDGMFFFAFKGVGEDRKSPMSDAKLDYPDGAEVSVEFADVDVWNDCGHGIHLSPTADAAKEFGPVVLRVKVHMGDMVCIPVNGHEKKFRVKRCVVIGEVKP